MGWGFKQTEFPFFGFNYFGSRNVTDIDYSGNSHSVFTVSTVFISRPESRVQVRYLAADPQKKADSWVVFVLISFPGSVMGQKKNMDIVLWVSDDKSIF